ncbi:TadA family conjugal transfer-associated ATPase [Streptacidiphilus rugosus]|uniref:TadA family conjugal transfer-associated ATPase n=1 Tax=Streptacidiphilus rugosus TaxID=405783 RepID=UPI000A04FF12|nr:TadA family conjugal transfer-associated ATPase [Streptacidiphilus rugosus]
MTRSTSTARTTGVHRVHHPATGRPAGAGGGGAVSAALLDAVRLRLAEAGAEPTITDVAAALRAQGRPYGDTEVLEIVRELRAEMVGAGPLDRLLTDPEVSDVLVNGPRDVWVDRGHGLQRAREVRFADEAAVRRLAQRLAHTAGRRLDDARPWADARLPQGVRLHAVLPPVAVGCTLISLRVSRPRPFTLEELTAAGSLTAWGAALLHALVRARVAFLVSGGTGTGKTTLLAALLGLVPTHERLVVVEDSAELVPDHPHVVRLEGRPPNQEGAGGVALRELVRQALRMRPDRLVVGEVRGEEVLELLASLNTGHEGGCGTVHANTAADVPARLEALAATAGLGRDALHSQLGSALDAVVHLVRGPGGRRRVAEVCVLSRGGGGLVTAVPAVRFPPAGGQEPGPGWAHLAERCGGLRAPWGKAQ